MAKSVDIGEEIKSIQITLKLADGSLVKPVGMLEDVLVLVDKFIIPTDFIVVDMNPDEDVPIILGRPFLATGDAVFEVKAKTVTLRVNGDNVTLISSIL